MGQIGQGKSILLAHLVEHFFYSEKAVYKNDIVLLINSTVINAIADVELSFNAWFKKEFNFNSLTEMINYFKDNPI